MGKFFVFALMLAGMLLGAADLTSGKMRVVLRKNGSAPQEFYYDGARLIRSFFYSWYAKGNWYSDRNGINNHVDRSGISGIKVLSQKNNELKVTYNCTDFLVNAEYTLLSDPEAVKVEFYLKARHDFLPGGVDPPGGFTLPLIGRDKRLSHYYKVGNDLSLQLLAKKDYPRMLAGIALDNCVGGFTTADGKEGFFTILDRRFYDGGNAPVINGSGGICYSKDVCRVIKKGEVIKGQFYLVPFKGNAAEVVKAAVAKFCSPDPAERWDLLASYRKVASEPLKDFAIVADTPALTAASGSTSLVFPQSPLPSAKAPAVKIESAKNQSAFAQIVLKAKKDLNDISFALAFPTMKEAVINHISAAPSDYPATAYATAGMYPDILGPANIQSLKSSDGNGLWLLTLMVPQDAAAGIHKGTVTVKSGKDVLCTLNVEVNVYDFALPLRSSYRTAFLAWTSKEYQKGFDSRSFVQDQRKLRITTPVELSTPADAKGNLRNPEAFRRSVRAILNAGDTAFRLTHVFMWRGMRIKDKCSPEAEAYIKNYTKQVYDILKEMDALKYVWFLMGDETHNESLNKKHLQWCKWVKEAAPDMPIFSTQNHPSFAIAEQAKILCGPLSSIRVLQAKFGDTKEYWLYENGFPFSLGQKAVVPRSMPLRGRWEKIAGYHQWSTAFWGAERDGKFRPGYFHGTAALYYPPEYGNSRRPVRSMRLINCAQGIIDFDCVLLLEQLIAAQKDSPAAGEAAEYLKKQLAKLVPDGCTITGSTAEFDRFRQGLMQRIVKLQKK